MGANSVTPKVKTAGIGFAGRCEVTRVLPPHVQPRDQSLLDIFAFDFGQRYMVRTTRNCALPLIMRA